MSAAKSLEYFDKVLSAVDTFRAATRASEHEYHWKKMRAYAQALFDRGPFRVGDRVRLTVTPEITEKKSWGWLGAKHFLVKGALGTVREVDFCDGHFGASVVWDDDSWRNQWTGEVTPTPEDRRGLYWHWDTQIERVPGASDDGSSVPNEGGEPK